MATVVGIQGRDFTINGQLAYTPQLGYPAAHPAVRGKLLMMKSTNSIFDDANYPARGSREHPYDNGASWDYPDGRWDPERHTDEFIAMLPTYRRHGFNTVSTSLMSNVPSGGGEGPWRSVSWDADGRFKPDYAGRLRRVLDATDREGLVLLIQTFMPNNTHVLPGRGGEAADDAYIKACARSTVGLLLESGHRNVLLEVVHEPSGRPQYEQTICTPQREHVLLEYVREVSGGAIPITSGSWSVPDEPERFYASQDFLAHGHAGASPAEVDETDPAWQRAADGKPVFCLEVCSPFCLEPALKWNSGAALFSLGMNDYVEGYQAVPIHWGITTPMKWNFMQQVAILTGCERPGEPPEIEGAPPCRIDGLGDGERVEELMRLKLRADAPLAYEPGSELRLNRVSWLIDGRMAAAKGFQRPDEPIPEGVLEMDGAALRTGPFGFDFRELPAGEHELMVLTNYRKARWYERSGRIGRVRFVTA